MARLVVASYNIHGGVDGWGRPFDALANCLGLDADVLVLQEVFEPHGGPSPVDELSRLGGYRAVRAPAIAGRVYPGSELNGSPTSWGPLFWRPSAVGLRTQLPRMVLDERRGWGGTVGLVVLSRLPITGERLVGLGRLPGDIPRSAVVVDVVSQGVSLTVVGVHMSHLERGSPIQFRRLKAELSGMQNTVVVGDMNVWGTPLVLMLPGWRRAARGPTWPSWRPRFQIDHALVPTGMAAQGRVEDAMLGSDHLPIRVEVEVEGPPTRGPGSDETQA